MRCFQSPMAVDTSYTINTLLTQSMTLIFIMGLLLSFIHSCILLTCQPPSPLICAITYYHCYQRYLFSLLFSLFTSLLVGRTVKLTGPHVGGVVEEKKRKRVQTKLNKSVEQGLNLSGS